MKIRKPAVAETPKPKKVRIKKAAPDSRLKAAMETLAQQPVASFVSVQRDEGVLMVRRCRYADGIVVEESADEQRVPTPKFEGEIARTRVSLGITKSLGGFEFARIDIMVELPCNPNPDDLRETNEYASQTATDFMNREIGSLAPTAPQTPVVRQRPDMSALNHG